MKRVRPTASKSVSIFEPLESRKLYSVTSAADCGPGTEGSVGGNAASIEFSLTPTAVQSGLDSLASADDLAAPAATDKVQLGNQNGVETYSVTIAGTGTVSRLTVDSIGAAVTGPTHTTTTYADLQTSDAAAATGLSAIVTAAGDTAIASTDTVDVTAAADGTVTYSYKPAATTDSTTSSTDSTATADHPSFAGVITVDSSGVAIGNQTVAFSVLPTAIQSGLNSLAPSGATALAGTSAQDVRVQTIDGVVLYSTKFTVSGTETTVTVDSAGATTSLPTTTTVDFSTIPTAAQTELQSLATAEGSTDTISSTATVSVYTEPSGAVLYSLKVSVVNTTDSSSDSTTSASTTHDITLTVDALGNPTVLAMGDRGGGLGGGTGGFGGGHGRHGDPGSSDGGSDSNSSDSTTTDTGLSGGVSSTGGSTSTAASKKAAKKAKAAAAKTAKLAAAAARKAIRMAKAEAKKAPTFV